jgi:WS/DGAT/MGAT family acyltransferase
MNEPDPVPSTLSRELVETLRLIAGDSPDEVERTLQSLRLGSQIALIAHDLVERRADRSLRLTPDGLGLLKHLAEDDDAAGLLGGLLQRVSSAMELGTVAWFDGSAPEPDRLVEHLEQRLQFFPHARQTLTSPAFALTRQVWIDDPSFDIRHHFRSHELSIDDPPDAFGREADRFFSTRLIHERPLWEILVIDDKRTESFAVLTKAHALLLEDIDGETLATALFDVVGDQPLTSPPWSPGEPPSDSGLVLTSLGNALRVAWQIPVRVARDRTHVLTQLAHLVGGLGRAIWTEGAPPSPLNVEPGPKRRLEQLTIPAPALAAARAATGATVNVLLLAALAGALRRWALVRGDRADVQLKVALMSFPRVEGQASAALLDGLAHTLVSLPVDVPNAADRLRHVAVELSDEDGDDERRRRAFRALRESVGTSIVAHAIVIALAFRVHNLMTVRYPSATMPLFLLGKQMRSIHPVTFLAEDDALSIGAIVYDEALHVTLLGDPDALPDLALLAGALEDELTALGATTESRT